MECNYTTLTRELVCQKLLQKKRTQAHTELDWIIKKLCESFTTEHISGENVDTLPAGYEHAQTVNLFLRQNLLYQL